ncbi:MAG: hypothetical protein BGO77_06670 [Caedibacter sp. 37-49]|nr:MAG: hypothetical protein BGO77_06670 [Caedibacter sp. 37-49]
MSSYRDDQRIRVIRHTQNKGVSAAINTGIQAANSKYIIHSGDDDLYLPSMMLYVQPILEQFLTYPNLAGGYVGLINIPEHFYLNDLLQSYSNLVPNHHYHSKINFLTFRNGPGFATHQVFLKTEIAKKTLYSRF